VYWKQRNEQDGRLSVRELVRRVKDIEVYLKPPLRPLQPQTDLDEWSRFYASEMFRTATWLFLKTVESGNFPQSPDIQEAVNETYKAILEPGVQAGGGVRSSAVVRSTVFPIFICGALMDDVDKRRTLVCHLVQNLGQEGVGNIRTVSNMLEELWVLRSSRMLSAPVDWRQHLMDAEILLV